EQKWRLLEGRQRGRQQTLGLGDQVRAIALPGVDATGPEFSLFHQNVQRALEGRGPSVAHGGGGDAEQDVLQRAVDEVRVGPNRTLEGRGHQVFRAWPRQKCVADHARFDDYPAGIVDQNGDINVAAGELSEVVAITVVYFNELIREGRQVEH